VKRTDLTDDEIAAKKNIVIIITPIRACTYIGIRPTKELVRVIKGNIKAAAVDPIM
jgi:hypothetical protein